MMRTPGRCLVVIAALATCPLVAFGDEIVQFRNGAEMAVRSHTVETDKAMIRVDLGENNFISFPMSMVDKIVNAGQNVFLNPTFHASNQGIAGEPSAPMVTDTTVHGNAAPVGYARMPARKGNAGMMLGESADAVPIPAKGNSPLDNQVATSRRRFNPLNQPTPGSTPQVILPPQMAKAVTQLVVLPPAASDTPQQEPPPPPESNGEEPNSP